MSMIHSTYLHDFDSNYEGIFDCDIPRSEQLSGWQFPLTQMRKRVRKFCKQKILNWLFVILEFDLTANLEEIESNAPAESMRVVRNLNYLALMSYILGEEYDYYEFWDMLRHGLDAVPGEQFGGELVLGRYWEGEAWDFQPDLVSYQFGIVLPYKVAQFLKMIEAINPENFATTLRTLNWEGINCVAGDQLDEHDIEAILESLNGLKQNLESAKEEGCGLLYLLN